MISKITLAFVCFLVSGQAHAQEIVSFNSHESSQPVNGYFYKCEATDCTAAVVVTPTCAGLMSETGVVYPAYSRLAAALSQRINVLLVDHFSTRGNREDCPKNGQVRITSETSRANDVLAAYEVLSKKVGVDSMRILALGFGGASPILAIQKSNLKKLNGLPGLAGAVAFYPVCNELPVRVYDAYAPLLILHGEADNWNPIRHCQQLFKRQSEQLETGKVDLISYPGAHHAFNFNYPTGTWPGTSFTVGADPAARQDSYSRVREFFAQILAGRLTR